MKWRRKGWARLNEVMRLSGDEDCGVGLDCRLCDRGGLPVAYYLPYDGYANPYDTTVVPVRTIMALLYAGQHHLDDAHPETS